MAQDGSRNSKNSNKSKSSGGSKLFVGIISFLLGFLFAILVEVGAIFGVYNFVMTKDLDSIMSTLGISNVDEEGNNKYINTDPNNGGVTNVKELFGALQGLVYQNGEWVVIGKTFDEFENLLPVTNKVLGFFYDKVGGYIDLDRETFEATPMSNLPQLLSDSLMEVKTAALMDKLGMDSFVGEDANAIVKSLIMGAETKYATVLTASGEQTNGDGSTFRLPVFYDYYVMDPELGPTREKPVSGGINGYHSNLGSNDPKDPDCWLCSTSNDEIDGEVTIQKYYLYYVPCKITAHGVEEAEYDKKTVEITDGTGDNAKTYRFIVVDYPEDTDFIAVKPDGHGNFILNYDDVYASLNANASGASDRFIGYSYFREYACEYYETVKNEDTEKYELNTLSGKNYFRDNAGELVQLDPLTLGDIVNDPFRPLDSVLVTDAIGKQSDVAYRIFKNTTLGALMRGEVDFDKLADEMEVSVFVNNVTPDNKVMAYIVHRLTDLTPAGDGTYTAVYDKYGDGERDVIVQLEDGYISKVTETDGITNIKGVLVNEVAALTRNMTVNLLMDVDADEPLMCYIGYGLTGVSKAESGAADELDNPYSYTGKMKVGGEVKTCYIQTRTVGGDEDAKQIVSSVWYIDGGEKVEVGGTKVNEVANRVGNFTNELTLGDVLGTATTENKILKVLKDTYICDLGDKIETLTLGDIFTEEEIEKNAILRQLRGTNLNELATAIDELLIQSIYSEEIYQLPSDENHIMEVVEFVANSQIVFKLEKQPNGKYDFVKVSELPSQSEYDALDSNVVYYTHWSEDDSDESMKIIGYNEKFIYYTKDEDGSFNLVKDMTEGLSGSAYDDALGNLTKAQYDAYVANGTKLYTYGEPKGMWKLVLNKGGREKAYTINNFNNMVAACATNVNDATLYELQDAGILQTTRANLSKSFYGHVLGEMKLSELIDLVIANAS